MIQHGSIFSDKYYGMDDDGYGHAILKECLDKTDHQMPEGGTYVNQGSYNPYNVHMGQLTVYRYNVKNNKSVLSNQVMSTHRSLTCYLYYYLQAQDEVPM